MRGTLFLIVGPSGSGKDTLIAGVRKTLAGTHLFPRRAITRPCEAGGEDHTPVTPEEFHQRERAGQFALSWRAHGLAYGIPAEISTELAHGKHVVINVSRGIVEEARANFGPVRVVEVTASPQILAARLAARGREGDADVAARLARQQPAYADVVVVNDGTIDAGVRALLAALQG